MSLARHPAAKTVVVSGDCGARGPGAPGRQPLRNTLPRGLPGEELEPIPKVYLERLPRDPFNVHDAPGDTAGWCARSYEDDHDATSWGGENVYDVSSCSPWKALDGTPYSEW